jgi:orotidine-5'-phosphate decarboxylase
VNPKDRLIFALDVSTPDEAKDLVQRLAGEVGLFKVGLKLFLAQGPGILQELVNAAGAPRIFVDLKLYDIPATILGAVRTIPQGVAWITLPSDLGPTALRAIVQGTALKVLAVTVLTSTGAADLEGLGYAADPSCLVVSRAKMAQAAGCAGVVCSGREVKAVKEACGPDFLAVCPGIRPEWAAVLGDDQKRTVTPYDAIRDGADYIVVGRPIRNYPEADGGPVAAARRVVAEIAAGLKERRGP